MIPLHPETTEDPTPLRWVIPAGVLDFVGTPARVPAPLGALLDAGTIAALDVGPAAVLVTLGPGRSWRSDGPGVRTALAAALEHPGGWTCDGDAQDLLAAAVEQVIAGEVGDYVRSHGGSARLVEVAGHDVTIALDGACADCPARGTTLDERFRHALTALYPDLGELRLEQQRRSRLVSLGSRIGRRG